MSPRRKKYDGDFAGRDSGSTEWGNTLPSKGKNGLNAPSKRATKNSRHLNFDESIYHEDADKDRYLLTYSDLITLLLGLFIILYAISNIDLMKYQKFVSAVGTTFGTRNIVPVSKKLSYVKDGKQTSFIDEIKKTVSQYGNDTLISVEENERGVTIHILDDILFKSGSADLNEGSMQVLKKIADILKQIPNDIRIEGHTDNVPISTSAYPSNWHLSVSRALNTAYHLINIEKLPADRVSIVGYSEYKPRASNQDDTGKKLNRRVDLVIIKK